LDRIVCQKKRYTCLRFMQQSRGLASPDLDAKMAG
jgi:hypothetical protein